MSDERLNYDIFSALLCENCPSSSLMLSVMSPLVSAPLREAGVIKLMNVICGQSSFFIIRTFSSLSAVFFNSLTQ